MYCDIESLLVLRGDQDDRPEPTTSGRPRNRLFTHLADDRPCAGPAPKRRPRDGEPEMNPEDFPAPREGFVIAHFLVVSDQDRSRTFYQSLLDGLVLFERDPVILQVAHSWL